MSNDEMITVPKEVIKNLVNSHIGMLADFAGAKKQRPPEDYQAIFGWDGVEEHLLGINCEDELDQWDKYKLLREQVNTLFCKRLFDIGLTADQISKVLNAIDDFCPYCRDALRGCHCMNDE